MQLSNLTHTHTHHIYAYTHTLYFRPDLLLEMLEILWVEALGPAREDYSPEPDCWEYPGKHTTKQRLAHRLLPGFRS